MKGIVYLVKTQKQSLYKIGMTCVSLANRIQELQTGCPYQIVYIFHIRVDNPKTVENYLHQQFLKHKTIGEWFDFNGVLAAKCIAIMQSFEAQSCFQRIANSKHQKEKYQDEIDCILSDNKDDTLIETSLESEAQSDLWYKWLPREDAVIKLLENANPKFKTFSSVVRVDLKKTETSYNRRTKKAIVMLLLRLERHDLLTKFDIDPEDYTSM